MCKVMMMAGVTAETREKAWAFIKEMAKELSPGNQDGCGYSAMAADGSIFGERWHLNAEAFVNRELTPPISDFEGGLLEQYLGAIKRKQTPVKYSKFGSLQFDSMTAITLHTRFATSGKEFVNTHPFVVGSTSLIHNGVISNASQLEIKQSTCDSEAILNLYVKHKVADGIKSIQRVADKLQGYYACGVFAQSKAHGAILDIFKCDAANLQAAYVKELRTLVFSTNINDIKSVCTRLGFTVVHDFIFDNDTLLRLDAIDGSVIDSVKFVSTQPVSITSFNKGKHKKNRSLPSQPVSAKSPVMRSWKAEEIEVEHNDWLYQGDWYEKRKK